jgi:hypothetical protein
MRDTSILDQFDTLPPHSSEAERCAIASAMLDKQALSLIRAKVRSDDFYSTDRTSRHSEAAGSQT